MSGSSSIVLSSEYFLIRTATPSISFVESSDEREFHDSWKETESPKMDKALRSLEAFFADKSNRDNIAPFDPSIVRNYKEYGYLRSDNYYKEGIEKYSITNLYIHGSGPNWFTDIFDIVFCFEKEPDDAQLRALEGKIVAQFRRDSLIVE